MKTAKLSTRLKLQNAIVAALSAVYRLADSEQWINERIAAETARVQPAATMQRLTVADKEYIRGYKDGQFWLLYDRMEFTYRVDGKRIGLSEITDHRRVSEQNLGKYSTAGKAYRTAGGWLPFDEFNRIADLPHLFTYHENGFWAEFYRGSFDADGERWLLAYRIYDDMEGEAWGEKHNSSPLFYGRDLGLPCRTEATVSYLQANLGSLLSWFGLDFGDTDRDYFDKYTPRQHAFRESDRRAELANLAHDMENPQVA